MFFGISTFIPFMSLRPWSVEIDTQNSAAGSFQCLTLHKSLGEACRIKDSQKQGWYLPLDSKGLEQKAKGTEQPKRN